MLKKFKVVFFFVLFLLLISFNSRAEKVINRIVAVVNGEIITSYDLKKEMRSFQLYSQSDSKFVNNIDPRMFLQKLIDEILLKEEAERLKIKVSDEEVNKRIELIKEQQNLTEEEFRKFLKMNHMTLSELKEKIRTSMMITRLLNIMVYDKVIVTPKEIREYYEIYKNLYNSPKKVKLRIIVLKDRDRLEKIREKIKKGLISFDQAAREFSIGPGADQGGELGVIKWDDLRPEFRENLKGLKEGDITKVFSIGGQYMILLVEKIYPGTHKSLKEVEEEIKRKIYEKKAEEMLKRYLAKLRKKAIMEIKI